MEKRLLQMEKIKLKHDLYLLGLEPFAPLKKEEKMMDEISKFHKENMDKFKDENLSIEEIEKYTNLLQEKQEILKQLIQNFRLTKKIFK